MSRRKYQREANNSLGTYLHFPSNIDQMNDVETNDDDGRTFIENCETEELIFHAVAEEEPPSNSFLDSDENTTEDEDENNVDSDSSEPSLAEELWLFFLIFNLPQRAMTYLLKMLNRLGHNVPSSFTQLKKEHSSSEVLFSPESLDSNFQYHYLSIENNLLFAYNSDAIPLPSTGEEVTVNVKINIDGLPLWKSSGTEYLPILIQFGSAVKVYPVGIFCGSGKPPLERFLKSLIDEVKRLTTCGIQVQKHCIKLGRVIFICDAVARAFLQCIYSHSSKLGCGYCRSRGHCASNRIIYPSNRGDPRCDNDYARFEENNQISLSPLHSITGLATGFPVDYQHAVCLGVVRRLFMFYFSSVKGFRLRCKVTPENLKRLSDLSASLAPFIPTRFQRRPRRFDAELKHFKAVEYRLFLLYLGPYVFKNFLSERFYNHFLLLHFSIYVFCCDRLATLRSHASHCIDLFVSQISGLFGEHAMSYNFHILLHLHYFVNLYGVCDSFSAFPFESFLGVLKRRTKKTRYFFKHSLSQLEVIRSLDQTSQRDSKCFSAAHPNNCAILRDKIVLVNSVSIDGSVTGQQLKFSRDLYVYPYPSSTIGFGFYHKMHNSVCSGIPIGQAICIPVHNEFLVLRLASDL